MYYLINSTLRTGEELCIETRMDVQSNSGTVSCQNSLYSQLNFMSEVLADYISNITGETFTILNINNNKMSISSNSCLFKLDVSGNLNTTQPYKMLGFNANTLPNTFYNNITAPNTINLNVPIFQSNILKMDVLKNSFNGAFPLYPLNYVIQNLCESFKNKLVKKTNLQWTVIYDASIDRVRINLLTPNYSFKFFWNNVDMINLSKSLGFSLEQTDFDTVIIADKSPEINDPLTSKDVIVLNISEIKIQTTNRNLQFSPKTTLPNQFLQTLAQQLLEITGVPWTIDTFGSYLRMVISQTELTTTTTLYSASLLFGDPSMIKIAQAFGFSPVNTIYKTTFVGSSPINYNIALLPNDLFKLALTNQYFTNIYTLYEIPFAAPIFNPVKYLQLMNNSLINTTGKSWTIQSNVGPNINNSSYLNIKLNDVDSSFRFFWGNAVSANISKSMGFANINMTNYTDSVVAGNIIDFNYDLTYKDILNFEVRSNVYYKNDNYSIKTQDNEYKLNEYITKLAQKLKSETGKNYSVYYDEITQKTKISVSDNNIYFKFLFGENPMKNIAQMLGFNPINMSSFSNNIISPNTVNGSITLGSTDLFVIVQKTDNYDYSILKPISITELYFKADVFITNLKSILDAATGYTWNVSTTSNFITIAINNPNVAFKFLWGEDNMNNIANALGFNPVNQTAFLSSIMGTNKINTLIQFTPNNILLLRIRDTSSINTKDEIITSYFFENIDDFYSPYYFFKYISTNFNADLATPLIFTYNSINNKLTMSSTNPFRFGFAAGTNLSKIMGFNFLESATYENSWTGSGIVDMTQIFLPTEIFILKYLKSITSFSFNFFDYYAYYHTYLLEVYLTNATQLIWKCFYDTTSKKISAFLSSISYKFITNDPDMLAFSIIYGFNTNNSQSFAKTQIGNNPMSFSSYNGSNLVYLLPLVSNPVNVLKLSYESAYNLPVKHSLLIEPVIFTTGTSFCTYLAGLLTAKFPLMSFIVNYDQLTHKITVSNTQSQTIKFRFLFGNSIFVSKLMGFNKSDLFPFNNSITSEKEIGLSGQFGTIIINPSQIIAFNKMNLVEINLPDLENITDSNNKITLIGLTTSLPTTYTVKIINGLYNSTNFAAALQNALNLAGIGTFTVALIDNSSKITINCTTTFKILWEKTKVLASMCGFNPINMSSFQSTITSDYIIDLKYPKHVYLDMLGVKYNNIMLNNKHMFLIGVNKFIDAPNNQLDKIVLALYDENNCIVSPTTNWNAVLEFL